MQQTTIEEVSAGGVVFRITSNIEFLVGMHSGYHKWVLPKGLVEKGESYHEAAVREVEEEVGVKATITTLTPIKTIEYFYFADPDVSGKTTRRVKKYQEEGGNKVRVHKKVIFYLMEVEKDLGEVGWEMTERKWVSFEEGIKLLSFESEREVLESAKNALVV